MKLKELLETLPSSTLVTVATETIIGVGKEPPNFVTLPFESEPITVTDLQKIIDYFHISNSEIVYVANEIDYLRIGLKPTIDPFLGRYVVCSDGTKIYDT